MSIFFLLPIFQGYNYIAKSLKRRYSAIDEVVFAAIPLKMPILADFFT